MFLTAVRVPCSFATRWARKLLRTPYKGEAATKLRESVVKNWGGTIQSVDEYEVFAEV